MEGICTLRKWGNSVGVIVPRDILKAEELSLGDKVRIDFKRKENPLKELRGALKGSKITWEDVKKMREEMESKWI